MRLYEFDVCRTGIIDRVERERFLGVMYGPDSTEAEDAQIRRSGELLDNARKLAEIDKIRAKVTSDSDPVQHALRVAQLARVIAELAKRRPDGQA